ncbi:DNA polymerase III subunit alpha [Desemzia sp. RIT804]|uniref:DNA polymerase III subunit alpha n=1 Tax=Desemzia sp. RIT 804 TaxID=2810209 RepID=UPI001951185B|nr:DNA polymerase III subunit alpha [Desemzia sp. RIT 804]MBM6613702.1 DNA polymerase III subunit alpha [Desemzia sp. RIT 804]
MSFVQLQVNSAYSLLQSTLSIEELVLTAKGRGYKTLALTDQNVLYGAVDFVKLCQKNEIKPVVGLTLEMQGLVQSDKTFSLVLLAETNQGYQHLISLSTKKMMSPEQPFSFEDLVPYTDGLIALTPGETGEIEQLLLNGQTEEAKTVAARFKDHLSTKHFFIGVQLHENLLSIKDDLIQLAEELTIEMVALNDVRYLNQEDAFSLKVLRFIDKGEQLTGQGGSLFGTRNLPESSTIEQQFKEAGLEEAARNTNRIAERIAMDIPLQQRLLPKYPIDNDEPTSAFLEDLCVQGLQKRVPNADERYQKRLKYELNVIQKMGFEDYFLIVWDVMAYAHQAKIVTGAGRGSAAGSLVSFVLEITDVDPIQYNLLFERFLNEERYNMPDIDLDFPDNRRDEVLQYVKNKYGKDHVAQIITFGTLAAKMALRDTARVFGLTQEESNQWSKAIPSQLGVTLEEAYQKSSALQQLVNKNEQNQLMFTTAKKIEGLPRHTSTHAAGVVISDQKLENIIPLQEGSSSIALTQYPMGNVEEIGLLKMDFLGLKNLTILGEALKIVQQDTGNLLQTQDIPMDDPETLNLFQRADTVGIFQFESGGIKNVLRKLHPESIEDIAAVNALYRPGPMEQIDVFIKRKKGELPIEYPHESLKEILEVTYGVMVYQEQVMQVASKMAGYSLGQADILRRAIGKKKKELIDAERAHFVKGAKNQGYPEQDAKKVYDYIERFANYGFNRSHSIAYSFIGYQMAYIKVHYPQAFYIALLNSALHNTTKMKDYLLEAKKRKIPVFNPDINQSYSHFTKKESGILFGLASIKGLRRDYVSEIIQKRKNEGAYKDFIHFLRRIDSKWVKEEFMLPLIYVGAFDGFEYSRGTLIHSLENILTSVKFSGDNVGLFDVLQPKYEEAPDLTSEDKLEAENTYLGIYLSGHPTERYDDLRKSKQASHIKDLTNGQAAKLIGQVKEIKKITTKKGEPMAFVMISDTSGDISLTLFPKVYRKYIHSIEKNKVLYVEGKIESRAGQGMQVLVSQIQEAEKLEENRETKKCFIRIEEINEDNSTLNQLKELLAAYPGVIPVILYYVKANKKLGLQEKFWIKNSPELVKAVEDLLGKGNIVVG